jgi:hypothetical protein
MTVSVSLARSSRAIGLIAGLFILAGMPTAACGGGGDDIKNVQSTATAAAKNRPSPTATPDPVSAYRQKVTTSGKKLSDASEKAVADMLSAAQNQADPKWPPIITADADAVIAAAGDVKALTLPNDSYRDFARNLGDVAAQLEKGAQTLKQAIPRADQDLGAQAFTLLSEGKDKLTAVLATLPAQ